MTNAAATDHHPSPTLPEHVGVVVVGAGLSGIGAGYRLQTEVPGRDYLILESREVSGGTWDLFRYPGVRSDSDMYTLGYPFKPWQGEKTLADGPSILAYVRETAAEFGIDAHIRYGVRVVGADFSRAEARWTLTVERRQGDDTQTLTMTCDFLYSCAGYYDYETPYAPAFEGLETYAGQLVHPQFWPEDLDYAGKRVVVIGSGATAVTLVPAMADGAGHVTMLQRTPTWIGSVPGRDPVAARLKAVLPEQLAYRAIRAKNIAWSTAFYQFCQRAPKAARRSLLGMTTRIVGDEQMVADHFTPSYDPWDQRLCAVPDADLFRSIRRGDVEVVTDTIARFVPQGIELSSGRVLEADIVVTATGLQLLAFGGIEPQVEGVPVALSEEFVWQGALVTGVPNFAVCIGYTNASWTLRADLTTRLVCKVLQWMDAHDYAAAEPTVDAGLVERPLLDLAAGYVRRSIADFPKQGDHGPWRVRQNYLVDAATTMRRRLDGSLTPTPRSAVRRAATSRQQAQEKAVAR
ncbi:MAG: NAD(P)/FAD-dependent oxidoreductase [Actinomycetota bacterium]|nr:NAD(P)/FAD-dependent oxidoreductase [Actinomycetota bacterium]